MGSGLPRGSRMLPVQAEVSLYQLQYQSRPILPIHYCNTDVLVLHYAIRVIAIQRGFMKPCLNNLAIK